MKKTIGNKIRAACHDVSSRHKVFGGPSASSFFKPNIHDIESFLLLRNKQEHAVRAFVRYCGLFTKSLVF